MPPPPPPPPPTPSHTYQVVDFYMQMPDPDQDGSAFAGLDPNMFAGLAKSPDEDASDDLDNLPDEDGGSGGEL